MLLIITNIKNVLTSLNSHGFTLTGEILKFVESRVYEIPENYKTIGAVFAMSIFPLLSYLIEKLAASTGSNLLITLLIILNQIALLTYPMVISFTTEPGYLIGSGLLLLTVTTFLKLVSFHHVMHDVRHLI